MAENSAVEWCDHTFNPWIGCTRVSPACDHCYAACSTPARTLGIEWGPHAERHRTAAANWDKPIAWNARAAEFEAQHGRRQRVFCASLADVFDRAVEPEWRRDLFMLIHDTPHLDWLLLTKRIGNAERMIEDALRGMWNTHSTIGSPWPWPNVWIGATVATQAEADRDIPKLLATPAAVRFVSIEPMLGPIDLTRLPHDGDGAGDALAGETWIEHWLDDEGTERLRERVGSYGRLDWVICGGESGPHARPMSPQWARDLRDQCAAAGVPFLFKQWGEFTAGEPIPDKCSADDRSAWRRDQRGQHWNDPMEAGIAMDQLAPVKFIKVGKKAAGRLLDGVLHDAYPTVRHG
ncbi:phage Gp37/Gp68 family protein [Rubrivivax sp. JA1026]|uniref:phage Gp37/Gp68 family protein n=1 Tax=Rubrivivax sp. JA1026 TaxID=2710888 RepID=UPI0013E99257|nr:phage Gp37/Gp68 family protein [Rubrivivax sp. JA1026]